MKNGIDARQMAAAPTSSEQAAAQPPNPFNDFWPVNRIVFRLEVGKPGKPWSDGTVSQTIADVLLPMGTIPNAYIKQARIVRKQKGDATTIDFQLPSTGNSGSRFYPVFDFKENADTERLWNAHRKTIVSTFLLWLAKEKAAGRAGVLSKGAEPEGVKMAADDLAALGL